MFSIGVCKTLLLQLLLSIMNLTSGELKANNSLHFCLIIFRVWIPCNAWSNPNARNSREEWVGKCVGGWMSWCMLTTNQFISSLILPGTRFCMYTCVCVSEQSVYLSIYLFPIINPSFHVYNSPLPASSWSVNKDAVLLRFKPQNR